MCHEPTSVGLSMSIGVGKGTVTLEEFDDAELLNISTNTSCRRRFQQNLRKAADCCASAKLRAGKVQFSSECPCPGAIALQFVRELGEGKIPT